MFQASSPLHKPHSSGLTLGWKTDPAPGIGFGQSVSLPPRYDPLCYLGDGHLATYAPTGAGKGRGLIIPTLLTYTGPVITIDPKGENFQVTARRRREMGQRVVVLDPFHAILAESDGFNPLDLLRLPGSQIDCDAEMLANLLTCGHEFTTDRYWTDTGTALAAGLIAHVASTNPPEERNLNAVRSLLYHDDLDYHLAVQLDQNTVVNRLARDEFVSYLSIPTDKTRPCVRSTASTYFKMLGSDAVAACLAKSTFDLADVVAGKPLTIYLILPPDKLESHRGLLRLWVGTLLTALMRRAVLPRQRTLLLLDECAQLGTLSALRTSVTLLRGYGVQVWSFWQDLSQTKLLYPNDWPTLLNNAAALGVFGVQNYHMAKEWAEVLGVSVRALADMPADRICQRLAGEAVRIARRMDYLRDPPFAGLFDANRRFGESR